MRPVWLTIADEHELRALAHLLQDPAFSRSVEYIETLLARWDAAPTNAMQTAVNVLLLEGVGRVAERSHAVLRALGMPE
jgi:hypothetical protein